MAAWYLQSNVLHMPHRPPANLPVTCSGPKMILPGAAMWFSPRGQYPQQFLAQPLKIKGQQTGSPSPGKYSRPMGNSTKQNFL